MARPDCCEYLAAQAHVAGRSQPLPQSPPRPARLAGPSEPRGAPAKAQRNRQLYLASTVLRAFLCVGVAPAANTTERVVDTLLRRRWRREICLSL
eukprot:4414267-Pleurochrysis_carterae.AAC.1